VKVRFAVSALGSPDPAQLASLVIEAEKLGFDTIWFSDVTLLPSTDPTAGVAFAAALSKRVKLGINQVPFGQQPFVIASRLAQLDQLAGGRLLITLVPGLDLPGERAALGLDGQHRGRLLNELIPMFRQWWAGGAPEHGPGIETDGEDGSALPELPVRPVQDPLEIWLGGSGPDAIRRAGRLSDGWLGSLVSPDRAGDLREQIQREASLAGRSIDPEHFGMSIGYARDPADVERSFRLRRPRPADAPNLSEVVPVGAGALRDLVDRLLDQGLSKFVIRPIAPVKSWPEELEWMAEALLDRQT
jgi:probable F420-dependent oxidoreductase